MRDGRRRKPWEKPVEVHWCWCVGLDRDPETSGCELVEDKLYGWGRSCEHEYMRTHRETLAEFKARMDKEKADHERIRRKIASNGCDDGRSLEQMIAGIRAKYPEQYAAFEAGQGEAQPALAAKAPPMVSPAEAPESENRWWDRD